MGNMSPDIISASSQPPPRSSNQNYINHNIGNSINYTIINNNSSLKQNNIISQTPQPALYLNRVLIE
jgi:hypothetical protein